MSNINIKNVVGNHNVFGDHNVLSNNFESSTSDRVLTRDEYFKIIIDIRDLERISLVDFLEDKYFKSVKRNPEFIKILYKDIYRVLENIDREPELDLMIQNGDFALEQGDIMLNGKLTNLDYTIIWLHVKLVEGFIKESPNQLARKMEAFENDFLFVNYDTPEYTNRLAELSSQIKKELRNKSKLGWTWDDLNDIITLQPNICGLGININAIFDKIISRKNRR
jgi:hypothetical protein